MVCENSPSFNIPSVPSLDRVNIMSLCINGNSTDNSNKSNHFFLLEVELGV